jgi:tetratricopeptide (TPR) repeat protein
MARKEDVLERGIRLFEDGDLEGAEACLTQVAGDLTQRGQASLFLARVYLKTERAEEAETSIRQALAIRRTAEAYLILGESLLHQSKLKLAEEAFLEAGRRDAASPEPCLMLGHVLMAQERLSEAARAYEQALLRDAGSTTARYYLAETLVQQGDLTRAATQLHYLLQREPTYVPAILLMGDMAFFQQDFRQAIVEYVRALELEVVEGAVYERLGQAFSAIGEFGQALKAFESSIKEHPTYWPCYLEAARLCETGKNLRKARRYYQAIAYDAEFRAEALEAIARIDQHFSQFNLSQPPEDGADLTEPEAFQAPETLTRSALKQTNPLDPTFMLQEGKSLSTSRSASRPLQSASERPAASPPPGTGPLNTWVQAKTDQLAKSVKEALPTDAVADAGKKLLEASGDLLPKGLKSLFKKPNR